MARLVDGIIATGAGTFRAGTTSNPSNPSTDAAEDGDSKVTVEFAEVGYQSSDDDLPLVCYAHFLQDNFNNTFNSHPWSPFQCL